jgi:hypothetical protein
LNPVELLFLRFFRHGGGGGRINVDTETSINLKVLLLLLQGMRRKGSDDDHKGINGMSFKRQAKMDGI